MTTKQINQIAKLAIPVFLTLLIYYILNSQFVLAQAQDVTSCYAPNCATLDIGFGVGGTGTGGGTACGGTAPAQANGIVIGTGTYSGTYTPNTWTYDNSASAATPCKWKCSTTFHQSGNTCAADTGDEGGGVVDTNPFASLGASPTGKAREIELTTSVSYGNHPMKYKWDYTNDGAVDLTTDATNKARYTYSNDGPHTAKVEVIDSDGDTSSSTVQFSFTAETQPLRVELRVDKSTGEAPLEAAFTLKVDGGKGVKVYRWDLNGDGTSDGESNEARRTYTYDSAGVYYAKVTVLDPSGSASDVSTVVVDR